MISNQDDFKTIQELAKESGYTAIRLSGYIKLHFLKTGYVPIGIYL